MSVAIKDYVDVRQKITDFGCRFPNDAFSLLPVNFESASSVADLLHASETTTLRKLLIAENLPFKDLIDGAKVPLIKNKSYEWAAPILFVSASLYSQNPAAVSIALGVIANYATEFFQGMIKKPNVRLGIVIENQNGATYKKVEYDGPIEGLKDLPKVIKGINE